jgi:chromosome segregation ATPase
LALALYKRNAKARDLIGGSNAMIFKDAATALASAHRRAEGAEQAASVEANERRRSHARITELEGARDDVRAKYQELIRSANGYGPALAQQDRRIEELESKCERLIFSCERTESERDEARQAAEVEANERRRSHAARDAATAEVERLKDLIEWIENMDPQVVDDARAALTTAPSKEGDGE